MMYKLTLQLNNFVYYVNRQAMNMHIISGNSVGNACIIVQVPNSLGHKVGNGDLVLVFDGIMQFSYEKTILQMHAISTS